MTALRPLQHGCSSRILGGWAVRKGWGLSSDDKTTYKPLDLDGFLSFFWTNICQPTFTRRALQSVCLTNYWATANWLVQAQLPKQTPGCLEEAGGHVAEMLILQHADWGPISLTLTPRQRKKQVVACGNPFWIWGIFILWCEVYNIYLYIFIIDVLSCLLQDL